MRRVILQNGGLKNRHHQSWPRLLLQPKRRQQQHELVLQQPLCCAHPDRKWCEDMLHDCEGSDECAADAGGLKVSRGLVDAYCS